MSTAEREPRRQGSIELADPPFWDPFDPRFPDSDGRPMADNQTQYKWMVTIAEGLDDLFRDRDDVLVACDLLWYFDRGDPRRCIAPDVFVAFDRPRAPRHSYREWLEGHAPQVVFEIHSPSNRKGDTSRKRRIYDDRGVEEYYDYDPETGRLEGWLRGAGGLEIIRATDGWTSPRLGVTFEAPPEKEALVLRRPDGEPFQHVQDIMKDRRTALRVAEIERRRRRAERRRRKEAELRSLESDLRSREADRLAREERERRVQSDELAREANERRVRSDELAREANERRVRSDELAREANERRVRSDELAREANERAARMAALLREMGVEPDQL